MGILSWIATGWIIGAAARFIVRGPRVNSTAVRIAAGIAGALLGGVISVSFEAGSIGGYDVRSHILAASGALALLYGLRFYSDRATDWPGRYLRRRGGPEPDLATIPERRRKVRRESGGR